MEHSGLQAEDALLEKARRLGASAAVILPAAAVVVRDELAGRCREPRCENYGLSRGCPRSEEHTSELSHRT